MTLWHINSAGIWKRTLEHINTCNREFLRQVCCWNHLLEISVNHKQKFDCRLAQPSTAQWKCLTGVFTQRKTKNMSNSESMTGCLCSSYQTFPSSLPNYLDGSALLCQYNCCRKMNWGSEYPVTADLSSVSDEGDWLPVTGSSIWWSSVPIGRGSAKDISEGFTSMDSDKGLFWLWMDSCSLKELSSAVESGEVSGPVETTIKKTKNRKKCSEVVHRFCKFPFQWLSEPTPGVSQAAWAAGILVLPCAAKPSQL